MRHRRDRPPGRSETIWHLNGAKLFCFCIIPEICPSRSDFRADRPGGRSLHETTIYLSNKKTPPMGRSKSLFKFLQEKSLPGRVNGWRLPTQFVRIVSGDSPSKRQYPPCIVTGPSGRVKTRSALRANWLSVHTDK